jgi:hypothetical protein
MRAAASTTLRLLAGALLLAPIVGPAAAGDEPAGPVARYLQGLDVAPGVEHRYVVLHPVLAQPSTSKPADAVSLGGVATPDLLAFGKMEKSASPRAEAVSFTAGPAALLTGDVLRTDTADFAVLRDAVVPGGKPASVHLLRVSREAPPDPKATESVMLGPVLPSAIRFLLLDEARAAEVREVCGEWAADVGLDSARRSPAELSSAESVKKRAADYRASFADFLARTPTGGREIVGVAAVLDGAFASFETFGDAKSFAAAWPRLLEAVAAEASVLEARAGRLDEETLDPADPDRFLADLKKRLLGVYGARPAEREVRESGRNVDFAFDAVLGRALVLGEDRVVHLFLVVDPARRGEKRSSEDPDPWSSTRRFRQTEEEKRINERRKAGTPEPPPEPAK